MPPMKAIQSATVEAAKLLGEYEQFGSLVEGKVADIIAVNGNPVEDITILEEVDFVMKSGRVYKSP